MGFFEKLLIAHAPFWVVALLAVMISKLYSKEKQTIRTIVRSLLASLVISFIMVEEFGGQVSQGQMFAYVFAASVSCDVIVEVVMSFGAKLREDPSIILKLFPWGKR